MSHSESGDLEAWQLHILGIAAGNARGRVFVELGVGFEGIAVAGVAVRF